MPLYTKSYFKGSFASFSDGGDGIMLAIPALAPFNRSFAELEQSVRSHATVMVPGARTCRAVTDAVTLPVAQIGGSF
jgi:hypothetical protein